MSTPTPRTDAPRIYTKCPACHNDTLTVNDDKHLLCTWVNCPDPCLIDRVETELTTALARIAELEKESDFKQKTLQRVCETIGIFDPLQLMAEAENNEESYADILIKVLGRQLDSLTRQLSESQAQLAKAESQRDSFIRQLHASEAQLTSAREDGARLDWLEEHGRKNPDPDGDWRVCFSKWNTSLRSAIDAARRHVETPAGGETGKASTEDSAMIDWLQQFFFIDDVGDESYVPGMCVKSEALELALTWGPMINGTAELLTNNESTLRSAIIAARKAKTTSPANVDDLIYNTMSTPQRKAPTPASTWQPIETAPKDGTRVIGFSPDWVHEDYNSEGLRECFCDGDGVWYSPDWDNEFDVYQNGKGQPTHWHPLPPPPQGKEQE